MRATSKWRSFTIEINGDRISANNASNPTDRNMPFGTLAEINQYIRAMYSVDCARFEEAW